MIDEMRRIRAENAPTPARMRAFAIALALNQVYYICRLTNRFIPE